MPKSAEAVVAASMRRLRAERDMSQVELADGLGLSTSHRIWAMETGRCRIHVNDVAALAAVFGVPVSHLLSAEPIPDAARPATYVVSLDSGRDATVTADQVENDEVWLNFYRQGERVFFAPIASVLGVQTSPEETRDDG